MEIDRATTSITIAAKRGLLEEVVRALDETLQRFELAQRPELSINDVAEWSQDGGWYLQIEPDPWSQDGGWVLDLEGRLSHRLHGRPDEAVVRDVFAALERARTKPDPNWQQSWGPLPQPEPGPGPDPARG